MPHYRAKVEVHMSNGTWRTIILDPEEADSADEYRAKLGVGAAMGMKAHLLSIGSALFNPEFVTCIETTITEVRDHAEISPDHRPAESSEGSRKDTVESPA